MSLEGRIVAVVSAIGADVKSARARLTEVENRGNLFVQDSAPTHVGNYMWLQTNYQVPGGMALWVEDGQP